ncbi:MAG: phosphoglycolate phosphatase [Lentimonas sp.]|jgi:phosphoglycolate phosphatase
MIHKPKAIIFDWDNTLVESWDLIHFAMNETLQKMDLEIWDLEKTKKEIHQSARELFPQIFGAKWEFAAEIFKKSYRAHHLEKVSFLNGAVKSINFLSSKDVPLFIISNKTNEALRLEANHLDISHEFKAIIGANDAQFDKPHRAPVDLALKFSNLNPDKDLIWFIGDTMVDMNCAIDSGCQPVLLADDEIAVNLVKKEVFGNESLDEKKPLLHFKNHAELLEKLKLCSFH